VSQGIYLPARAAIVARSSVIPHHWFDYKYALSHGLQCYDALGARIDRVRAVKVSDDGICIRTLGTVDDGRLAVVNDDRECVEFEAFIKGGKVKSST
jgi:hypothetical protein